MQAPSLEPSAGKRASAVIPDRGMLPPGYSAVHVIDYTGLQEADLLYRNVFGYGDPTYSLNPNLLVSLGHHGGTSVGVYNARDQLVGYAYGFPGLGHEGEHFHFSQAAVVDPGEQGKGLGRALKVLQAEEASRTGQHTMRWTFDPMVARNAHFNLDSLGAVAIEFLPSYFDRPGSDRLLISWNLESAIARSERERPLPSLGRAQWGSIVEGDDDALWVPIPADAAELSPPVREHTNERLGTSLQRVFADNRVLRSCRRVSDDTAAYLAVPTRESHGKEKEQS